MGQVLRVNGKEYLPSAELGKKFNYTSDYISKLARDEKVLGTQVGRQWFIEPESLRTYIQQLEVEKKINQEHLSRQRKLERQRHSDSHAGTERSASDHTRSLVAAGQALSVMLCGVLTGLMFLSIYTYEVAWTDLKAGAVLVFEQVASEVSEGFAVLSVTKQKTVANPFLGTTDSGYAMQNAAGPQMEKLGEYTTFPRTPTVASSTWSAAVAALPFSDEVVVEVAGEVLEVKPIFRDAAGARYQVSVVPIETDESNELLSDEPYE